NSLRSWGKLFAAGQRLARPFQAIQHRLAIERSLKTSANEQVILAAGLSFLPDDSGRGIDLWTALRMSGHVERPDGVAAGAAQTVDHALARRDVEVVVKHRRRRHHGAAHFLLPEQLTTVLAQAIAVLIPGREVDVFLVRDRL